MITITPEKVTADTQKWHEMLLNSREQQCKNGDQNPMSWEIAKQKIRNKKCLCHT